MPLPFEGSGKRFFPYFWYLRQTYGGRIAKVPLDGGFTCPNRDGSKGVGGCCYCSAAGSGDFIAAPHASLREQYDAYRAQRLGKWQPVGYIPYFQSFTGTYAPPERLRALYAQACALPDAVGLAIATRPDCVDESVCAVLAEFAARTDVTVELGVQTIWDDTAARCGMCHTFADLEDAMSRLRHLPVSVCIHLINGLPGETAEQMVQSARTVGGMGIHAVKLHALHVVRGTPLAGQPYRCLSREQYVSIVCDQLEVLPPHVVIQRLTGDGKGADLIAPAWSRGKRAVLAAIDRELARRGSVQGCRLARGTGRT
ncbi:MAG TPA: TIGR01212 family radical SAM protein [Clostridiales bacterium]|nr:TIGR01212 family radical SAM protein [Clostridiales bacterium]